MNEVPEKKRFPHSLDLRVDLLAKNIQRRDKAAEMGDRAIQQQAAKERDELLADIGANADGFTVGEILKEARRRAKSNDIGGAS